MKRSSVDVLWREPRNPLHVWYLHVALDQPLDGTRYVAWQLRLYPTYNNEWEVGWSRGIASRRLADGDRRAAWWYTGNPRDDMSFSTHWRAMMPDEFAAYALDPPVAALRAMGIDGLLRLQQACARVNKKWPKMQLRAADTARENPSGERYNLAVHVLSDATTRSAIARPFSYIIRLERTHPKQTEYSIRTIDVSRRARRWPIDLHAYDPAASAWVKRVASGTLDTQTGRVSWRRSAGSANVRQHNALVIDRLLGWLDDAMTGKLEPLPEGQTYEVTL